MGDSTTEDMFDQNLKAALEKEPGLSVKDLANCLDVNRQFMAGFLAALEERGEISCRKVGPARIYFNGCVERAHRTHAEEFYEVYDGDLDTPALNPALLAWERTYNTVRPHQALDGRTPGPSWRSGHPAFTPSPAEALETRTPTPASGSHGLIAGRDRLGSPLPGPLSGGLGGGPQDNPLRSPVVVE